jgi:hypothetical protein
MKILLLFPVTYVELNRAAMIVTENNSSLFMLCLKSDPLPRGAAWLRCRIRDPKSPSSSDFCCCF